MLRARPRRVTALGTHAAEMCRLLQQIRGANRKKSSTLLIARWTEARRAKSNDMDIYPVHSKNVGASHTQFCRGEKRASTQFLIYVPPDISIQLARNTPTKELMQRKLLRPMSPFQASSPCSSFWHVRQERRTDPRGERSKTIGNILELGNYSTVQTHTQLYSELKTDTRPTEVYL